MVDTSSTEADILTRLRSKFPRVYPEGVPDETPTPAMPYVLVYFTTPRRAAGDHHIVSSRHDTNTLGVTVKVVSLTYESARAAMGTVLDSLTGYRPTNSGEMILEGGSSYTPTGSGVKPTAYSREVAFTVKTNLAW